MEYLKRYDEFIKENSPPKYLKLIRSSCISLAIITLVADLTATLTGFEVNWLEQTIALLMTALTFTTKLPVFSLLLIILGMAKLSVSALSWQSLYAVIVMCAGSISYSCTRTTYTAFKEKKSAAERTYNNDATDFGLMYPAEDVRISTKGKCPNCDSVGLYVFGAGQSRSRLRRIFGQRVSWAACCPQCNYGSLIKDQEVKKLALDCGKYATYRRVQPSNGWLYAFGAFICVFIAAAVLLVETGVSQAVVYSSDVDGSKMGVGKQFVGEDLMLLDCFATTTQGDWNGDWGDIDNVLALHMLAYLENENGAYVIPVQVDPDDDIFMPCVEYMADDNATPVFSNIHGYIDSIAGDKFLMLKDTVESYKRYFPEIAYINNEVLYWNNEAAANEDKTDFHIFLITTAVAGIASVLCFAFDWYFNSEAYCEMTQNKYDMKKYR